MIQESIDQILLTIRVTIRGGSTLGRGPPDSLVAPFSQIQKLSDRSDVISDVRKCSKIYYYCDYHYHHYTITANVIIIGDPMSDPIAEYCNDLM